MDVKEDGDTTDVKVGELEPEDKPEIDDHIQVQSEPPVIA